MSRRLRLGLLWTVLAVLALIIWRAELQRSERIGAAPVAESRRLLPVPIDEIGVVEIMARGTMHRFERDPAGAWFYHGAHDASQASHEHVSDPARAATIDTAMIAFGRMQREQQIPLPEAGDEYGVARPELFILVYRPGSDAPLARYAVGSASPDGYSRYLLPVGAPGLVTVPDFHIKNLLALIEAMKAAGSPA